MGIWKGKAYTYGLMAVVMKVIFQRIKEMDMEYQSGGMEGFIKDNGEMDFKKEKEDTRGRTEDGKGDSGKRADYYDKAISFLIEY